MIIFSNIYTEILFLNTSEYDICKCDDKASKETRSKFEQKKAVYDKL